MSQMRQVVIDVMMNNVHYDDELIVAVPGAQSADSMAVLHR